MDNYIIIIIIKEYKATMVGLHKYMMNKKDPRYKLS